MRSVRFVIGRVTVDFELNKRLAIKHKMADQGLKKKFLMQVIVGEGAPGPSERGKVDLAAYNPQSNHRILL